MLYIESFTFNPFAENTYIVYNEQGDCYIIDPGMSNAHEEDAMLIFLEEKALRPLRIINTHAHIDHILGVDFLKKKYGIPFGLHKDEDFILQNAMASAMMFGMPLKHTPVKDFEIRAGEPIILGDDTLKVLFTPGHSPGSVSFYYEEGACVIGGDVLFQGSIGRTDLPGGNFDILAESIRNQLYTLPDETIVYSGHGAPTSIGWEKQHNPFVR